MFLSPSLFSHFSFLLSPSTICPSTPFLFFSFSLFLIFSIRAVNQYIQPFFANFCKNRPKIKFEKFSRKTSFLNLPQQNVKQIYLSIASLNLGFLQKFITIHPAYSVYSVYSAYSVYSINLPPRLAKYSSNTFSATGSAVLYPSPPFSTNAATTISGFSSGAKPTNHA